ncbi:MAG: ATP-grasp enzyme [Planctomycetota bacterium]
MLTQAVLPTVDAEAVPADHGSALQGRLVNRVKSLATLLGLTALAPLCFVVVGFSWVATLGKRLGRAISAEDRKKRPTVLITGGKMTKALELSRCFNAAGWRVVLCETPKYWLTGHRYSRAVDRFQLTPELHDPAYGKGLAQIARDESADLFVPVCSPASSRIEAIAAKELPDTCRVMHVDADQIDLLDDKYQLAKAAAAVDLPAPKSFRITNAGQVDHDDLRNERRRYLLKSIRYDALRRLDLTRLPMATAAATREFVRSLPISTDNPWVLQEFIEGEEYCTHSTIRDGRVLVHICCRSSDFQINYEHVEVPEIEEWVRDFASAYNLTGQVSFDFIRANDDGRYYAIECNPRTHSAITAFHSQRAAVANAYASDRESVATLKPSAAARPTFWLYHELGRLLTSVLSPSQFIERVRVLVSGKDAIFAWSDPLPFLMVHHWQIPLLLAKDVAEGRGWVRLDFNIGKLVQAAGD